MGTTSTHRCDGKMRRSCRRCNRTRRGAPGCRGPAGHKAGAVDRGGPGRSGTVLRCAPWLGNFPAGDGPQGVAFDGANIWVANGGSHSVTKLRAADGFNLGTFPVGHCPLFVAFDGANVWVTGGCDNSVTKLRAADGLNLGTFPVGSQPNGMALDGGNAW